METISCVTFWNNYNDHLPDPAFLKKELAINKLMEPLGFDLIFAVEHHFSNYSMGPDHFQFLAYMAAIPLAFLSTAAADLLYVFVALVWIVPDSRIERSLNN